MKNIIIIASISSIQLTSFTNVFCQQKFICHFFQNSYTALLKMKDFNHIDIVFILDCLNDNYKHLFAKHVKKKFKICPIILMSAQLYTNHDYLPVYYSKHINIPLKKHIIDMVRQKYFC